MTFPDMINNKKKLILQWVNFLLEVENWIFQLSLLHNQVLKSQMVLD